MKGNNMMLLLVAVIAVVAVLALFGAQNSGILDTKFSPSLSKVNDRQACLDKCYREGLACVDAAEDKIRETCYDRFPGCKQAYAPNGWCIQDEDSKDVCDDSGCESCATGYLQHCWDNESSCMALCPPRNSRGSSS